VIGLVRACHWQPTLAVTAIATSLALSVGRGTGALVVAAAVGTGQLSVGWSNDYIDRHRDVDRDDKPIATGDVSAAAVRRAALVALIVCVPLSLASGWRAGAVHLAAVGAAWMYNLWLKATVLSPFPYIAAFGLLPAFVTLGKVGHPLPPVWAFVGAALLGCGAHFVNTLSDLDDDLRFGIRGLPQRLGAATSLRVGAFLLDAAVIILILAPPGPPRLAALGLLVLTMVLVVGLIVAARHGRPKAAWYMTLATALVAVTLLLANGSALV
jgi:4-hydroxybenzoate polyprenyltransferase